MKHGMKWLALMAFVNACGQPAGDSLTQEAWNWRNDPAIMGIDSLTKKYQYETQFDKDLTAIQDEIEAIQYAAEGSLYFTWTEERKAEEIKKLQDELERRGEQMECRDTNAGAFHLVITNQIARLQEGFIADVTRDDEVWNQAVFGYTVLVEEEKEGRSPDAAPLTVKEVTVTTTMKYIVEVPYHLERGAYNHDAAEALVDYRYRLEIDQQGSIVGGKWLSYERPDFLWKQEIPKFEGAFTGVEEIYQAARLP